MFNAVCQFFLWIGAAALLSLLLLSAILFYITKPFPNIKRHKEEETYLDPNSIETLKFPSIEDTATLELSVIIPAYNEEKRLPIMLDECIAFLEQKLASDASFSYEVIIVSDGSNDGTVALGLKYAKKFTANRVRVLELIENRGKGGAVRMGMLSARGRTLLFADADGASNFADYEKLAESLNGLASAHDVGAIAIGSRAHLEEEAIAKRSFFRTVLMYGFHFLVWLLCVRSIRDTQCGFKLLTRSAAQKLFTSMHVERWAFDVELLYLAEQMKIPMTEVTVRWTEIEGSKLTPFWSWVEMGMDLVLIWLRYAIGAWKILAMHKKID